MNRWPLGAAAAAMSGCATTDLTTEGGTLLIGTAGLAADPVYGIEADAPFVAGTHSKAR